MSNLQKLRIVSIVSAMIVGLWLPLKLLKFPLAFELEVEIDLWISFVSIINLYIHFTEKDSPFTDWKSWLKAGVIVDVICIVPFYLIEDKFFDHQHTYLSLLNILAARHIWKIKDFLNEVPSLPPMAYRLIPIGLMMPVLVHLVACGWIALGSGTAGPDSDKMMEYVRGIYWSFTTLTTVGYGDISAKTAPQMLFACFTQLIGVGVFGFVLSNVASLLSRLDAAREHHMENLDRMETFMLSNRIPGNLKNKIRTYYHYLWKNHKGMPDRAILEGLPLKFQSELLFFINRSIIEKVPFLTWANHDLLEELMRELRPRIAAPGENIFRAGEDGDAMYFIHSGKVEIIDNKNTVLASLSDGKFFGEMALITSAKRSASAKAATYCDLYVLSKQAFQRAAQAYPDFLSHIEDVINQRNSKPAA